MKEFVEIAAIFANLVTDLEEIKYKKMKLESNKAKPKPKRRKRKSYRAYTDVNYKQIKGGKDE